MWPVVMLMQSTDWAETLRWAINTGILQEAFRRWNMKGFIVEFYSTQHALFLNFLSSDLSGALGTTYCSPDLGNHNTKYKIIISSQFYRHYFYCLVTCETPLRSPFARRAGMLLSVVLVLAHVLLILVNPLHTIPSGFLSVYGTDWMKAILKQCPLQSDLLSIQEINTLSHLFRLYLLPLDPWPKINNGLVLTKIVYNWIYHL